MCAAMTAACARTLRAATSRATSAGCNTPLFSSRRALLGHPSRRHMAAAVQAVREVYDVMETYDLVTEKGYTYLDVRSKEEFANGHAPTSTNIPLLNMGPAGMEPNPNFVEEVKAKFKNTNEKLVVACQAGNRSTRACAMLQDSYVDLVNSKPGWAGWLAAGLPVEK